MSLSAPLNVRLVTTGARSGLPREVALYAFVEADRYVIVGAGMAGATRTPGWVYNLRKTESAVIRQGSTSIPVTSREVSEEQRQRLWAALCERFPYFPKHQMGFEQPLPIFVLDRVLP